MTIKVPPPGKVRPARLTVVIRDVLLKDRPRVREMATVDLGFGDMVTGECLEIMDFGTTVRIDISDQVIGKT